MTTRPRTDGKIFVVSRDYGQFDDTVDEAVKRQFPDTVSYGASDIGALEGDAVMNPARDVIGEFGRRYGLGNGLDIYIESNISRTGGMSSSTGLSCSLWGALSQQVRHTVTKDEFWGIAYPVNVKVHGGAASGAEIHSSVHGGYHKVRIDRSSGKPVAVAQKLAGIAPCTLIVGNSGVRTQTRKTVPYVAEGRRNDTASYEAVFTQIGLLTEKATGLFESGDLSGVGSCMDEDHELLARELGVSHPKLNRMARAAKNAGAFGAKMAGGGKGGIIIALANPDTEWDVTHAIQMVGAEEVYKTVLGGEGLKIEEG